MADFSLLVYKHSRQIHSRSSNHACTVTLPSYKEIHLKYTTSFYNIQYFVISLFFLSLISLNRDDNTAAITTPPADDSTIYWSIG